LIVASQVAGVYHRSREKVDRMTDLAAGVRAPARPREAPAGPLAEGTQDVLVGAELAAELERLLEVVRHGLIGGHAGVALLAVAPVRERLVQAGAVALGQGRVCDLADRPVPEPEAAAARALPQPPAREPLA